MCRKIRCVLCAHPYGHYPANVAYHLRAAAIDSHVVVPHCTRYPPLKSSPTTFHRMRRDLLSERNEISINGLGEFVWRTNSVRVRAVLISNSVYVWIFCFVCFFEWRDLCRPIFRYSLH